MTRRDLFSLCAAAALPGAAAAQPRLWIDSRLAALPRRPWRKVHLDYHNSEHVKSVAERFDGAEFAVRLKEAHVDSIVVFAKDMHGYFYYPSEYGPVHPGLKRDLLGEQVAACRKAGVQVSAYYCTTWDNYLAANHPEWLVLKRDGSDYMPKPDAAPSWTALCLSHEPFVELMLKHTREFVSRYELDGAWFDMPVPIAGECYCAECLRSLKARGLDPTDTAVQRRHKQELEVSFLRRLTATVKQARPGCQVDYNGQAVYGLGERVPHMDNIDLEALPSASQWGYYYYPLVVRYVRTFGVSTYVMTGRFVRSWADFGGLKLPSQLLTEVAGIVANGGRCDVGDQLPPSGRLDPAVYHVIGKAYGHVRKIEPYLEGAAPVAEAAMLIAGLPLDGPNTDAHLGLTKLLIEARVQFDCVEPGADWERYGFLILPESLAVDERLAARLRKYVDGGGSLVVCDRAGVLAGTNRSWLEPYGFSYAGESPFRPAYLLPREGFTGDIPAYEYALYNGASQWRVREPGRVAAQLGVPEFQRSGKKYTSHAQSPFDRVTEFAAVARSGRVSLLGFPLGASYFNTGYWVYRRALQHVLPELLVTTNAPLSAEVQVTHQPGRRYLVHIVNWSASRGTPKHPVFHEDPVPLGDVSVALRIAKASRAYAVVSGRELPLRRTAAVYEVTVPGVAVHEIVAME